MKVKISATIIDSNDEPIMLILSDDEKELIGNMGSQSKFCSFPEGSKEKDIMTFMEINYILK
jgi:hypothetical protein